jgi:hypothetical protein
MGPLENNLPEVEEVVQRRRDRGQFKLRSVCRPLRFLNHSALRDPRGNQHGRDTQAEASEIPIWL